MKKIRVLLTCEHASNRIPTGLKQLFLQNKKLLTSHRAWDKGALPVARTLAKELKAPLIEGRFSRLVVDLNRSAHHRGALSEITRQLPQEDRQELIATIHVPFRQNARRQLDQAVKKKQYVCHFSIHSFTPALNGEIRNCEIGILYDPQRQHEKTLAKELKKNLQKEFPKIRLRMNYPYRGISDGHTAQLRKSLSDQYYAGIELELNQAWLPARRLTAQKLIAKAIQEALNTLREP